MNLDGESKAYATNIPPKWEKIIFNLVPTDSKYVQIWLVPMEGIPSSNLFLVPQNDPPFYLPFSLPRHVLTSGPGRACHSIAGTSTARDSLVVVTLS